MAKFSILNPLSRGKSAPNTVNFENGRAFTQTAKLELVSVLITTFLEDEFYRTEKQTMEKIRELIAKVGGVTIIDDYAHHPTEIEATLEAARTAFAGKRIIAAFQPHLYSRTRDFHREFARALSAADVVYLADLYPAREKPIPGVSAKMIVSSMAELGGAPAWEGPRSQMAAALAREVRDGDIVLTIGAGDITNTGPELAQLLSAKS